MKNGIYFVNFNTAADHGEGTVVVKDSVVNGGDGSFVYQGSLSTSSDGAITGKLHVFRANNSKTSVMGLNDYQLSVKGKQMPDFSITIEGTAPGSQFTLRGIGRHVAAIQ